MRERTREQVGFELIPEENTTELFENDGAFIWDAQVDTAITDIDYRESPWKARDNRKSSVGYVAGDLLQSEWIGFSDCIGRDEHTRWGAEML